MLKIGIIGGVSYQSTLDYYKLINDRVNQELGGNNCANLVLVSRNFQEFVDYMDVGDWENVSRILHEEATELKK